MADPSAPPREDAAGSSAWASRTAIGGASAVSAVLTWLLQIAAAHVLGVEGYARFMVLWGLFFTVVGVLQGLQQEVTRAAASAGGRGTGGRVMGVAAIIGAAGAAVLVAVWLVQAARSPGASLDVLVVAGACFLYALGQGLNGALAAQHAWGTYAGAVALEGVARAVVFGVIIVLTSDRAALAVGLAAGALAWLVLSRTRPLRAAWHLRGDVTRAQMVLGSTQAMAATGCSALLISGFPLLLGRLSAPGEERATGVLLAVLVATRAPLLLVLNAYQGPILTHLVAVRSPLRSLARWSAVGVAVGAVAAVAGYVVGGPVIRIVYGAGFDAEPLVFPAVVAAGLALSLLTVTGWALVATSRHSAYLAGWVLATVVTAGSLALDLPVDVRVPLALVLGPLAGVGLHVLVLVVAPSRGPRRDSVAPPSTP